jgi:hypothetical protein
MGAVDAPACVRRDKSLRDQHRATSVPAASVGNVNSWHLIYEQIRNALGR